MLTHHVRRRAVQRPPVVVGNVLSRGNQDVADSGNHFGPDNTKPTGGDRLIPGGDPGPTFFALAPGGNHGGALLVTCIAVEVQLKAPRLPRDKFDPRQQRRLRVDVNMGAFWNVKDPVIRGHDQPISRAKGADEVRDR